MYQKILVPLALDHGLSPTLFDVARVLLKPGGTIEAIHVVEAAYGLAHATQQKGYAEMAFDRARAVMQEKLADQAGVTARVIEGHIYRAIIDAAAQGAIDCIVMGSHRPGLGDYLLGSTAARVVRHAPCAVHVHR